MESSRAVRLVVEVMTPYIGETMARSATEAHCQRLGIAPGHIDADQVEALIAKLGTGLNIFLGREKSSLVVEQMRAAVRAAGETR